MQFMPNRESAEAYYYGKTLRRKGYIHYVSSPISGDGALSAPKYNNTAAHYFVLNLQSKYRSQCPPFGNGVAPGSMFYRVTMMMATKVTDLLPKMASASGIITLTLQNFRLDASDIALCVDFMTSGVVDYIAFVACRFDFAAYQTLVSAFVDKCCISTLVMKHCTLPFNVDNSTNSALCQLPVKFVLNANLMGDKNFLMMKVDHLNEVCALAQGLRLERMTIYLAKYLDMATGLDEFLSPFPDVKYLCIKTQAGFILKPDEIARLPQFLRSALVRFDIPFYLPTAMIETLQQVGYIVNYPRLITLRRDEMLCHYCQVQSQATDCICCLRLMEIAAKIFAENDIHYSTESLPENVVRAIKWSQHNRIKILKK